MLSASLNALLGLGVAFVVVAGLCPALIRSLTGSCLRQPVRDDGPGTHLAKAGTPTAGGLAMVAALVIVAAIWGRSQPALLLVAGLSVGFGAVGLADDLLKTARQRPLGLKARHKLLAQALIAVAFVWLASRWLHVPNLVALWGWGERHVSFAAHMVVSVLVIVGLANAVNLTDGLDGLAAGSCAIVCAGFTTILLLAGRDPASAIYCAALCGACLAFLLFNAHPAAVFMGDTGALALGAGLAGAASLAGAELLACIAGLLFLVEAGSVVAQVVSFRLTGKRVLRMSPLHHHFELCGLSETQVVRGFWSAAFACCVIAALLW